MSYVAVTPLAPGDAPDQNSRRRPLVLTLIGGLGFAATVAQLALIRELLGVMAGNELTVGIALGCWLVLTALGTWIGSGFHHSNHPVRFLARGLAVIGALPLLEVLALRASPGLFVVRGASVDPIATILTCLLALAPFCLGSGALLAYACRTLAREENGAAIRRVYAADAIGSVAGALIFTFVLSPHLDHAALLCWPAVVAFGLLGWIGRRRSSPPLLITGLIAATGFTLLACFGRLDARSTGWQHRGTVVYRASSPFGRVVGVAQAGQITLFENGLPVVYSANAVAVEELAHYAMVQRPEIRSVLLLGGGVAGVAREIARYPGVQRVTCIELDPAVIAAGRRLLPENFADPRIVFSTGDGRKYVQRTRESFDAVLVSLPDPSTFQLNRYFSAEFFAEAHRVLRPGGVFATGIGRYENYLSREATLLLASTRRSLATTFRNVETTPGARVFFLGSDEPLRRDIAAAIASRPVAPTLVKRSYLDATLTPDRLADLDRATAVAAPINRDFHPVLSLLQLQFWLAQFRFPAVGLLIGLGAVVIGGLARSGGVGRLLFAAGFAASALEITSLMALQIYYGALYRQIGTIVAVFMFGLALGAWLVSRSHRISTRTIVRKLGLAIAVLALVFAAALPFLGHLDRVLGGSWAGQSVVVVLTVLLAAATGAQFASAATTSAASPRTAPRLFTADLSGAAVAAFAVSAFLLPWLGLTAVCLATAALNLVAVALTSGNSGRS